MKQGVFYRYIEIIRASEHVRIAAASNIQGVAIPNQIKVWNGDWFIRRVGTSIIMQGEWMDYFMFVFVIKNAMYVDVFECWFSKASMRITGKSSLRTSKEVL
jgi:hypothetical protein